MKLNRCSYREETSLLAAGALHGEERIATERHLAECAECQIQFNQLKKIVAPLTAWEKSFSSVEVTDAMRASWADDVGRAEAATPVTCQRSILPLEILRNIWCEVIWPRRYAWSGLVVLWAAMLMIDAQLSDHPKGKPSSSSQEVFQAWRDQNEILSQWKLAGGEAPIAPVYVPNPQSRRDLIGDVVRV
jgi:anti-sigma factor RsiW